MKIILTIFCVCVILFGGGCAVLLSSSGIGQLILIPLAIVALNFAVLAALYNWGNIPSWPLYVLAGIDFILALVGSVFSLSSMNDLGSATWLAFVGVGIAALKGYLTVRVARNMQANR